ncbi:substrate-binding domain-containing protein [Streptomyces longisporoflavus]|uniref:Substrate-binding domain-containing protein n=1 Tax=Streptomyces longisporoflavus TaxID=28044 RepID=A0ABW7R4V2_9ACTN
MDDAVLLRAHDAAVREAEGFLGDLAGGAVGVAGLALGHQPRCGARTPVCRTGGRPASPSSSPPTRRRGAHSQHHVGELQVRHLAAAGHQRLGYAALTDTRLGDFFELRRQGVRDARSELGLDAPVVRKVEPDADVAETAVQVTAVCAFNDEVAFALLVGMRAAGLSAPGDLAMIGVDNIPVTRFAEPPLITVGQHMRIVAGGLAEAILRRRDFPAGRGRGRPARRVSDCRRPADCLRYPSGTAAAALRSRPGTDRRGSWARARRLRGVHR